MNRKLFYPFLLSLVFVALYLMITSYIKATAEPAILKSDYKERPSAEKPDLLNIIYTIADRRGMKVISDLNMAGGAWYGKISADEMSENMKRYVDRFHNRYGNHKSFWGWYLNHEINPIRVAELEKSAFWRKVWKAAVDECHRVRPGSKVTVSPFFLLDKDALRGFEYLQPAEYEKWWAETLKETGIDVLLLQDSGEHLSFFTLAEREPFFAAFANACKQAGTKLWMNVEAGQVNTGNWTEAIEMEKNERKEWEFSPIDFLSRKLELAAKYGESIVNWGYFPFMNPLTLAGPWPMNNVDGQKIASGQQQEAYDDYKAYYDHLPRKAGKGYKCRPAIRGTLWMLQKNYAGMSREDLQKLVEQQIALQQAAGFDILWLTNTPANMELAEK